MHPDRRLGRASGRRHHEHLLLEHAADACRPDLVLVSSGFDAHVADAISAMRLEDRDYARLTRMVLDVARAHASGRLVSLLDGGYSPVALRRAARFHLEALMG